jgi:hypothetical protein
MCGCVVLRGGIRRRGGAKDLWETEQLILSMGQEWKEAARILALKATKQSKDFCIGKPHIIFVVRCVIFYIIMYSFSYGG